MTVTTASQPIVGAYGDIYAADTGTPIPTSIDTPGAAWTKLGLISEDGASWTPPEEETSDIKVWQSSYPARTVTTGLSSSLSFALDQWDRNTIPFAMGGGTFEDAGTTVIYHPPAPGSSQMKALFMKVLDLPVKLGLYFAKGKVTGRDDAVFKSDEAALLNVEFSLQGDPVYEPFNLVFDKDTFPESTAPVPPTGATEVVGAAGNWTPSGSTPPANLADLQASSIVASPLTAWSTDSYVVLGDNTHAHWDSDSWETGDAP